MRGGSRRGRGSARDRAARRAWLVDRHRVSPCYVACFHCGRRLLAAGKRWEVDRWPLPGAAGGTYRRDNIVVACRPCNVGENERRRPPRRQRTA